MRPRTGTRHLVPERGRVPRGILDTSVVMDPDKVNTSGPSIEVAISSITLANLAAGTHATSDPDERVSSL